MIVGEGAQQGERQKSAAECDADIGAIPDDNVRPRVRCLTRSVYDEVCCGARHSRSGVWFVLGVQLSANNKPIQASLFNDFAQHRRFKGFAWLDAAGGDL